MSSPHIAGAMALLWCALPNLRHQITASRDAINNSAVHIASTQCGTAGPPNNVYGWGRVDIAAAVGTPPPPTPTPTPTATATATPCGGGTPTPTPPPCANYTITQGADSIVPTGTRVPGSQCDDCVNTVALPFSYTLYDQTFNAVNLSSNGNAQFLTVFTNFTNNCLPEPLGSYTIFPYWDDLDMDAGGAFGIYTSITGSAPNRIFNIEWRAQYFPNTGTANLELRLYEGQTRFDVIYGTVDNGNTSQPQECRETTTALLNTSAMAPVVRPAATKSTA